MQNDNHLPETTTPHWAYSLPESLPGSGPLPRWARETVAEHAHPEYWASLWGWSGADIEAAKGARPAPSDDDRRCAANVLREIAAGHCSFGAVSPYTAIAWLRVADWLSEVQP